MHFGSFENTALWVILLVSLGTLIAAVSVGSAFAADSTAAGPNKAAGKSAKHAAGKQAPDEEIETFAEMTLRS